MEKPPAKTVAEYDAEQERATVIYPSAVRMAHSARITCPHPAVEVRSKIGWPALPSRSSHSSAPTRARRVVVLAVRCFFSCLPLGRIVRRCA